MRWDDVPRAMLGLVLLCGSAGALASGRNEARAESQRIGPGRRFARGRWIRRRHWVWQTPLAGDAASSPVVAGGKSLFLTTIDSNRKLIGLCLDENSGKILWQKRWKSPPASMPTKPQQSRLAIPGDRWEKRLVLPRQRRCSPRSTPMASPSGARNISEATTASFTCNGSTPPAHVAL